MARSLRIQYPGAWYHVMNRGANRRPVFLDELDRQIFLKLLGQAVTLWRIRIHAYSLMDNHYHLIIETPLGNISRTMRHIDGVYTQRFNRRHERDGPLMRGRFKSILIERESYLLELVRYVHLNGVRAGRYDRAKDDPFTSHRGYLRERDRLLWLSTSDVLSHFSKNTLTARALLEQFISQGTAKKIETALAKRKWPAILGSKRFMAMIRSKFLKTGQRDLEIPQMRDLKRLEAPEDVLKWVGMAYGVSRNAMTERSSARRNEARQTAMLLLRRWCHLSYREIGSLLGGVSYGAVAPICLKMQDHDQEVANLEKKVLKYKI